MWSEFTWSSSGRSLTSSTAQHAVSANNANNRFSASFSLARGFFFASRFRLRAQKVVLSDFIVFALHCNLHKSFSFNSFLLLSSFSSVLSLPPRVTSLQPFDKRFVARAAEQLKNNFVKPDGLELEMPRRFDGFVWSWMRIYEDHKSRRKALISHRTISDHASCQKADFAYHCTSLIQARSLSSPPSTDDS